MIELSNINKIYYGKGIETQALKDANLNIESGELVSISGKSGCGKTTLMNVIGCIDSFTSGRYLFNGEDISAFGSRKMAKLRNRMIGYIFQSFCLIEDMNALENVCVPLGYRGVGFRERKKTALAALDRVGLSDKFKNRPSQLSGGQQQRVAIARAIASNPTLILADEPTGNLDSRMAEEIKDILLGLNKEGKTVLIVTHDIGLAQLCRRQIHITDGILHETDM